MRFEPTRVQGCFVVTPELIEDERGYFARSWCAKELADHGLTDSIAQINTSGSALAGTIRGLHWQQPPHAESKLVRCTSGAAFDVCADVRRDSPTYGNWFGIELSSVNRAALYVPAGCAHGYQTLRSATEMLYTSSAPYVAAAERGLRWNDPAFDIDWPISEDLSISAKDLGWPDL
jgi:dTDP-4-dehydrorhamnose 3,5-epimerase